MTCYIWMAENKSVSQTFYKCYLASYPHAVGMPLQVDKGIFGVYTMVAHSCRNENLFKQSN
jgi:hypothetical protein